MPMWALVVIGSCGAIGFQRWLGTLELLVAAPVPFRPCSRRSRLVRRVGSYSLGDARCGEGCCRGPDPDRPAASVRGLGAGGRDRDRDARARRLVVRALSRRSPSGSRSSIRSGSPLGCSFRSPSLPGWVRRSAGSSGRPGGSGRSTSRRLGSSPWPIGMCLVLSPGYLLVGDASSSATSRASRGRAGR